MLDNSARTYVGHMSGMCRNIPECVGIFWNVSEYLDMCLECVEIFWNVSEYSDMCQHDVIMTPWLPCAGYLGS